MLTALQYTNSTLIFLFIRLIGQAVQVDEVTLPSVAARQVQPSVGGEPGHKAPL